MPEPLTLDTSRYLEGWRLQAVIICLFFGAFLVALDSHIINIAIPNITSEFKALESAAWYGSAYLLTSTAFQPIYGSLYRYFNEDNVYRVSIAVFEIGSILCASAPTSNVFILGRAIAGLGAAGVFQGTLTITSIVVPLPKRPLYMGIVISVFVISTTVGPVLGGVFTQYVSWRWCFWINLPIGGAVLLGLLLFLKIGGGKSEDRLLSPTEKLKHMDALSCLVFVGTMTSLLLALTWGGQSKPWSSGDVIGSLVAAAVGAILFVLLQWRRGNRALIPLRILKPRSVWAGALVLFFIGGNSYVNGFSLPFWFRAVKAQTPQQSGVSLIALLLPQIVSLVLTGGIVKVTGDYIPWMIAGEVIAIGGQPDSRTVFWAAGLAVSGFGTGMAMQLPYIAVALVLPDEDLPVGNALCLLFYQVGGAIAISAAQTIDVITLLELVPLRLPQLSPDAVIAHGAADLSALTPSAEALSILKEIWNLAIVRTMILSTALVGISLPLTFAMEWLNSVKVTEQRLKANEEVVSNDDSQKGPPQSSLKSSDPQMTPKDG
ncbi:major facilitator superfamily domain-containing protein [Xylaria flabelliformis]|nr:major facilitator superfamily domain-containing protein [Xylaria flabelliformis]